MTTNNVNIPINKGNYSIETIEREEAFNRKRGFGVEEEYKLNRSQWSDFPKNFHVSEYPIHVDIELSTFCNLKCPFCFYRVDKYDKKIEKGFINFELYKKIIDEISGKVFSLRLSLKGEPTLYPNLIEAINYAKNKNIKEVSMITNAGKITPEFFKELMNAGIDCITISFDGLYEEYEKNRYPLKFNEMYEQLKKYKEIKEKADKVKPVIKIQTIWPAIEKNPTEFYDKMSKVCDLIAFNAKRDYAEKEPLDGFQYEEDFACPQYYQRLVVGINGLAVPCTNGFNKGQELGDLNKQTVYEIWHGEKLNYLRGLNQKKGGFKELPQCKDCSLPRKTTQEIVEIDNRNIIVQSYI